MQTDPSLRLRVTRDPCHAERGEASRSPCRQTLRCAQGDTVRQLRLMRIGADESAVGTINRPLRLVGCTPLHMIEGALIDESSSHYQARWT